MVSNYILEAMDKKRLAAAILLELSKAFDSVSHPIILQKLYCVGASLDAVKWFSSHLSGRSHSLRIGSSISSPLPITHGVPQGAILSLLMFCIYTNYLPLVTQSCDINSHVDDSKVYLLFAINNINQATQNLEADLGRVAKWCSDNQLLINPDKTKLLLNRNRQLMRNLSIDITLKFLCKTVKPIKDLGVIFDAHLTYDFHITKLISSCMSKLRQINKEEESSSRNFTDQSTTDVTEYLQPNRQGETVSVLETHFPEDPEDVGKDTGMRQEDAEESISPRMQSPSRWVMNNDLYLAKACQLLQYKFYWKEHTNAHVLSFEAIKREAHKKEKSFWTKPYPKIDAWMLTVGEVT